MVKMLRIPHPIPYQGSKRRLASVILEYAPKSIERFIDPFAGSGAITLAAAARGLAKRYILGDSLQPLASLLKMIIEQPLEVSKRYAQIWGGQLISPRDQYLRAREEFNRTQSPDLLLYLLVRCVKNAVRFNPSGEFNQSADHRRRGMHPDTMKRNVLGASHLLRDRCEVFSGDYAVLLDSATPADLIYMDPPYQGTSEGRDRRYFQQLDVDRFISQLGHLNRRGIPFLLSFDGYLGNKSYGRQMPKELGLTQILIRAGRSSQATLSGRSEETIESLYISPLISQEFRNVPQRLNLGDRKRQLQFELRS